MCRCTTFMIAHRLGTLATCAVRLEIEDGRVAKFEQRAPAEEWRHQSKEIS
jgi:ABC-type multidrug transport system fused ATPase/permease subunit